MTKLERARELLASARERAATEYDNADFYHGLGKTAVELMYRDRGELADLEAEMYGDLVKSYEAMSKETI